MIIAAWNIQRAGNLESHNWETAARAALAWSHIWEWVVTVGNDTPHLQPALIFLAEATLVGGPSLVQALNFDTAFSATHEATFYGTKTSSCSFILVLKKNTFSDQAQLIGATTQRPYLKISTKEWALAGMHMIANRKKSMSEILDALNDLTTAEKPSKTGKHICLIGDMNYDLKNMDQADFTALEDIGFTAHEPGINKTYQHKKNPGKYNDVIDFCIVSSGTRPQPFTVLNSQYKDWDNIDHAPIFYDIPFTMDEGDF